MQPTIGSLFSGTGALDLAVARRYRARVAWHVEFDPGAQAVLRHHYPDVPLYPDVRTVDWAAVERPQILTGGFPCQDVSVAGRGRGLIRSGGDQTRSGLWSHMSDAIDTLRPDIVVIENVRGLLDARADSNVEPCPWCLGDEEGEPALRALGAVLGDLADIGYDAQWHGLRASDIGAPHRRFRIFIAAEPADRGGGRPPADASGGSWDAGTAAAVCDRHVALGGRGRREPVADAPGARRDEGQDRGTGGGDASSRARGGEPQRDDREPAADAAVKGLEGRGRPGVEQGQRPRPPAGRGSTSADTASDGRDEGRPEPTGLLGRPDAALGSASPPADTDGDGLGELGRQQLGERDPDGCGRADVAWGAYEPAIRRWERITGRTAPDPVDGSGRLAGRFTEWMMGWPSGWVTDPAIWAGWTPSAARNAQLKLSGNGVVDRQAEAALAFLLDRV